MSTAADPDLVALDRFASSIYWSDDDIAFADALPEAIDEWTASAATEHNESQPFSTATHDDELAASVHELLAAVAQLSMGARPGLTAMRALSEALADWSQEHSPTR
jgi:hypothetical protein